MNTVSGLLKKRQETPILNMKQIAEEFGFMMKPIYLIF